MLRHAATRTFCSRYLISRASIARSSIPTYHSPFKAVIPSRTTMTSSPVKLPAGPHWRNNPESLENCEDEFLWAFTGIEQDSNGIVKPLLYYNNGSCIHLVEYPKGSCQYYIFNGISDEIFKIHHPTNLDDIIEELGKPGWKGIKMESTQGENGSKIVYLD